MLCNVCWALLPVSTRASFLPWFGWPYLYGDALRTGTNFKGMWWGWGQYDGNGEGVGRKSCPRAAHYRPNVVSYFRYLGHSKICVYLLTSLTRFATNSAKIFDNKAVFDRFKYNTLNRPITQGSIYFETVIRETHPGYKPFKRTHENGGLWSDKDV